MPSSADPLVQDDRQIAGEPTMPSVHIWQNLMCLTYLMILKRMEEFFLANGCRIVDRPDDADWILLGACGAFYHQIDHFFDEVEDFCCHPARIAVYGCLPRVSPDRYAEVNAAVHLTIGPKHPEAIENMLPSVRVPWRDVPEADGFRMVDYRRFDPTKKYVIVQHGCNSKCVFCPHIKGIGPQESVPREAVLATVRRLLADGAKTVMLEGRDIGSWGTDLEPPGTFPDLLKEILRIEGEFRVFVNQLGANWVIRYRDRLLELLMDPKVGDVHIPVQTVSDRLLRLMGREPGVKELAGFLRALRARRCPVILRTDMLIGFPTETEEEFQQTLQFVHDHFDEVAYYGFELHPNTEVATMGLPFYDREFIEQRVQRAAAFIEKNPRLVWHRGGQKPPTMLAREQHKLALNRM